jgi:hypothetical protein
MKLQPANHQKRVKLEDENLPPTDKQVQLLIQRQLKKQQKTLDALAKL